MKKAAFIVLLMLGFSMTFAKQHKTKKKAIGTNNIISVESYHTACFGRCPIYKVKLEANGTVTYTGIRFVKDSGVYKKNIGAAKAKEILRRFAAYKADTCRDRYETLMQDLPGNVLTIQYTGKTKQIQNTNLGPDGLKRLHAAIDSIYGGSLDNTWHAANNTDNPKQ